LGSFLYSIFLIAFGLIIGQILKIMVDKNLIGKAVPVGKYVKTGQMVAILLLNPIVSLGAFWVVRINDPKLFILPFLGLSSIAIGGILGLSFSRLLKHERKQTGSMFVSGAFSNTVSFGGLICFVMFGEASYAFISMYKLFEEVAFYMVGYPIAKTFGSNPDGGDKRNTALKLIKDPFILIYFTSIALGITLNISGITRPPVFRTVNEILIPLTSIILVISVGFNMQVKAVGKYLRECFTVASIKFLFLPSIITLSAYVIGIGLMNDGMVLKIVLVLASMPPAFNSLIPPQIYGLDVDLANSCWLFCTGGLVVVLPVLFVLQSII